jgi:hypothetical protein
MATAKDLGIKESEYYGIIGETAPDVKKEEPIRYPSFELKDAQIDRAGAGELEEGDEVTATVRLRVRMKKSEATEKKKRRELGFDVNEITGIAKRGKDGGDDDDTPPELNRKPKAKVKISVSEALAEEKD